MGNDGGIGNGAILKGQSSLTSGIDEVTSIRFPDIDVEDIDITSMDVSTNVTAFRSFVPGLIDGGSIEVDLNYAPANAAALISAVGSAPETWTIAIPAVGTSGTATFAVKGYIGGLSGEIPQGDKIIQTVKIKASGVPTFSTS